MNQHRRIPTLRITILLSIVLAILAAAPAPLRAGPDKRKELYKEYRERLEALREKAREVERARKAARKAERRKLRDEYSIYKIETFDDQGDASRRVDIVFMSDGFTEKEFGKFFKASEQVAAYIMKQDPFKSYRDYINLHRISVVAKGGGFPRNSFFGANVNQHGALTFADTDRVLEYARMASDCDLVVVICNIEGVRSTARMSTPGIVALSSSKWSNVGDTLLHELGHAFGKLGDEYVDEPLAREWWTRPPEKEPHYANVSIHRHPARVKWHYWIGARTRLGKVGAYKGAAYHPEWFTRPQPHCLMRCDAPDFCLVCMERMIATVYDYIDPIDEVTPHAARLTLWADESVEFEPEPIDVKGHGRATCQWFVDGAEETGRKSLRLRGGKLDPGEHQVLLVSRFTDKRVRRDKGRMSSVRGWTVTVLPYDEPSIEVERRHSVKQGERLAFDVSVKGVGGDMVLRAKHLPPGAAFDREKGRFAWDVPENVRGAFRVVFEAGLETKAVREPVEIEVTGNRPLALDAGGNTRPVFDLPGEIEIDEGERLLVNVQAVDTDGDAIVYACEDLPPGAAFDHETGELSWQSGFSHGGKYKLTFEATDGRATTKIDVALAVNDLGMQHPKALRHLVESNVERPTQDIFLALHGGGPRTRLRVMEPFCEAYPPDAVFAEMLRLCRDGHEAVRREALTRAGAMIDEVEDEARARRLALLCELIAPVLDDYTDRPEALRAFAGWIETAGELDLDRDGKRALRDAEKSFERVVKYNESRGIEME